MASPTPLERRLTLHQLRILKTVVDRGGMTRAAEALSLSQPGITHQMKALAGAVGHPLLQPRAHGIELTAVGREVYERAARVLAVVEEMHDAVGALTGLRGGAVRVVGDTTVGIYVLPDALAAFRREHPAIGLRLDVANRAALRDSLVRGDADVGVVGRLWGDEVLAAEPFLAHELMCYSAPDHPLVAREPLRPAQLMGGPLLLREPGSGTRESTERILRDHGVDPVPAMEMSSNGALKRAVAGGLGITVLSTYAVRLELALSLLRPLRVHGFPVPRMWHVVWARERLLSPAGQAFRRFLLASHWRQALESPLAGE